jgi:rhodanese-related sulfurtransferase
MLYHRWIGCVALALLCFLKADAQAQFESLFGGGPKVETIGTEELRSLLERQQKAEAKAEQSGDEALPADFVLVDVRSDAEVNVSMIPGAITKAEYEKNPKKYAGRTVIPYCTVGGRSGAYATKLAKNDIKVKNYKGSILQWAEAGLPFVTPEGKQTNRVHTYSDRYRIPAKYEQVTR